RRPPRRRPARRAVPSRPRRRPRRDGSRPSRGDSPGAAPPSPVLASVRVDAPPCRLPARSAYQTAARGSKGARRLRDATAADERPERVRHRALVPSTDAVVPREPDRLCTRARRRQPEPEAARPAVEEPRAEPETAELPAERAARDGRPVVV